MSDFIEIELELEEEIIKLINKAAEEEKLTRDEFINKIIKEMVDEFIE